MKIQIEIPDDITAKELMKYPIEIRRIVMKRQADKLAENLQKGK